MQSLRVENRQIRLLIFMVPLSVFTTDLYLASFRELGAYFGANSLQLQLSQSVYLAGFALSTLLLAFLADRFGCKKVLIAGLFCYVAGSFISVASKTTELFIFGRLFQAFGGSASSIITRIMVRERCSIKECAPVFSWMFFAVSIALIISPLVGAGLQSMYGWRANFFLMCAIGSGYFIAAHLIFREDPIASPSQGSSFRSLFQLPDYCFYTLFTTITWSGLISCVALSPFLISFYYQRPPFFFGCCYSLMMCFFICGNRCSRPQLMPGISSLVFATFLLMLSPFFPSLTFFLIAASLFLFGTGYILPQVQLRAIAAIQGKTNYGFALMYFSMMLASALSGLIIARYAHTPFWAAQLISVFGLSQFVLYYYKIPFAFRKVVQESANGRD